MGSKPRVAPNPALKQTAAAILVSREEAVRGELEVIAWRDGLKHQ
jgi:hypothetical protein